MKPLKRITLDPSVMGGKPCIRGMRITVGTVVGLVAAGHDRTEILRLYPCLEPEDIDEALSYAAWRTEEVEAAGSAASAAVGCARSAWNCWVRARIGGHQPGAFVRRASRDGRAGGSTLPGDSQT